MGDAPSPTRTQSPHNKRDDTGSEPNPPPAIRCGWSEAGKSFTSIQDLKKVDFWGKMLNFAHKIQTDKPLRNNSSNLNCYHILEVATTFQSMMTAKRLTQLAKVLALS